MKASTAQKLAQGLQLLILDNTQYTIKQLSKVTGISEATIKRNTNLIKMLDFALQPQGYYKC